MEPWGTPQGTLAGFEKKYCSKKRIEFCRISMIETMILDNFHYIYNISIYLTEF